MHISMKDKCSNILSMVIKNTDKTICNLKLSRIDLPYGLSQRLLIMLIIFIMFSVIRLRSMQSIHCL